MQVSDLVLNSFQVFKLQNNWGARSLQPSTLFDKTALVFPLGNISAQTSDKNRLVLKFPVCSSFFHVSGSDATVHVYVSTADCCLFCPLPHRSYARAKSCATRDRPNRETLCGLATLIIGTLGGSGHHGGNNWPGFPSTTQLPCQQTQCGNQMTSRTLELS